MIEMIELPYGRCYKYLLYEESYEKQCGVCIKRVRRVRVEREECEWFQVTVFCIKSV